MKRYKPLLNTFNHLNRARLLIRLIWQATGSFFFLILGLTLYSKAEGVSLDDIEAAFIERLPEYIEWNEKNTEDQEIVISIIGDSTITSSLKKIGKNSKKIGKKISILVPTHPKKIKESHIIVLVGNNEEMLSEVLKKSKEIGALTISRSNGFGEKGAMINFYTENNKLRFEINTKSISESNIKISSQLLKLARIIKQ